MVGGGGAGAIGAHVRLRRAGAQPQPGPGQLDDGAAFLPRGAARGAARDFESDLSIAADGSLLFLSAGAAVPEQIEALLFLECAERAGGPLRPSEMRHLF